MKMHGHSVTTPLDNKIKSCNNGMSIVENDNAADGSDTVKCSAISTMDRGMPDHDVSDLVAELRSLILADAEKEPSKFRPEDVHRVKTDEWATERYLLRNKLDVKAAYKMMRASFEFKNSPEINITEFPREFYLTGAVFPYARDRANNVVLYLRCKVNQKIPVVLRFMKAFLAKQIELADLEAQGKGIVIVFDVQGIGLSNVDVDFLFSFLSMISNYFPKGLSYFLIHELPWFLRSILTAVRQWMPAEHRDLLKLSTKATVTEYIARENLPDFMGGICKRDYRHVPKHAISLKESARRWNLDPDELYMVRKKYAAFLPSSDILEAFDKNDKLDEEDSDFVDANSVGDDKENVATLGSAF